MSLSRMLRSRLFDLLASEGWEKTRRALAEIRRRLTFQPHVVRVFLELDDPYSYLLATYLDELSESFDIELRLYLTEAVTDAYRPAPELWPEYALEDSRALARELGIPFLDKGASPPAEYRRRLIATLATQSGDGINRDIVDGVCAYWRGDGERVARLVNASSDGEAESKLADNQRRLKKLGHYNTAMIHYGGEWYWGVDRLHYLVSRLEALGLRKSPSPGIDAIRQAMRIDLPVRPPANAASLPPLELFFSFRSPYSYLAIERVRAIANAFGVELRIRLVLPMVMRKMQVPRAKAFYIAFDAGREARRLGVPFGKFHDPVGRGIESCMAAAHVAQEENRHAAFVTAAAQAIFARRIDVATEQGLRKVTAKAALFWPFVADNARRDDWRKLAEAARRDMTEAGSWGVPTMKIGDWKTWGQDRDWLLVRHLEDLCQSEDGVIV